ncbi:MAG TPA: DUF5666 domain-containing protein [Gemmatales bacterium]|nr:DUF5666 domain-containing protein [Gemmatales bacterium]
MFRVLMSRSLVLALLSLFVVTAVLQADQKGKKPKPGASASVEGTISAVGAASVTITKRNGVSVTVAIDATTKIERNDRHVALSSILVGDRGEAKYNPATLLAGKVEATGP